VRGTTTAASTLRVNTLKWLHTLWHTNIQSHIYVNIIATHGSIIDMWLFSYVYSADTVDSFALWILNYWKQFAINYLVFYKVIQIHAKSVRMRWIISPEHHLMVSGVSQKYNSLWIVTLDCGKQSGYHPNFSNLHSQAHGGKISVVKAAI